MIAAIARAWQQLSAVAGQERFRIGPILFRLGAGLTILTQYLTTYYQRHLLYGPDGVVPYAWFLQHVYQHGSFSLYALDQSALVFEVIFHLSIGVTILWVIGWQTRLMTLLTWIALWSLHERNPALWDGGDNLIQIVLIYALFADLGRMYALDAGAGWRGAAAGPALRRVRELLHMAAVLAVGLQLCLVYGTAGLAKVPGALWQNGTALYYIVRAGEFAWAGYGAPLLQHGGLVTLLTYGTLAFQLSFPFLFWLHPTTRRLALLGGICFHLGVGAVLGLTTFAAFLISIELMLIPDRDYAAVSGWCRRRYGQLRVVGAAQP